MAKLEALPAPEIVLGLKGLIDYYYWRGIPVARAWPKPTQMPRNPRVTATYTAFGDFASRLTKTAPELIASSRSLTLGSGFTWRDLVIASAYGNANNQP